MNLKGRKILIAEDVLFNAVLLTQILSNWNAEVCCVKNGQEAVESVKTNDYDLVLMDIEMPVMCGYEATKEIRAFNTTLPIIALTASEKLNDADGGVFSDFVMKPYDPAQLFTTINKYVYLSQ